MSNTKEITTLNREQCDELVERIVREARCEAKTLGAQNSSVCDAYALGVLTSKAADWLSQLEELRGEIFKINTK